MERRLEVMDVVVAVGLSATIVASGLVLMAANGMQIRTVEWESANNLTGTDFLQPVLGQAIVDHVLLERRHTKEASAAITQLEGLTLESNQWRQSPYAYLDSIATSASWAEAEHASRVQIVMGRAIVNFTRRGILNGLWFSVDPAAHDNPQMISVTEAMGQNMDRAFIGNWQPNIGRGIVGATQESKKRSASRQEQLGTAIVGQATVQENYEPARAAIQEQLGSATVVATISGSQQKGVSPDRVTADGDAVLSAPDAVSRISSPTIFIAGSFVLISLFATGLFMFTPRGAGIPQKVLAHSKLL